MARGSGSVRLTPVSKAFVVVVSLSTLGFIAYRSGVLERIAPAAKTRSSVVPTGTELPAFVESAQPAVATSVVMPGAKPGCTDAPEVRFDLWAWNAQMGLMLATGGPRATEGSLMCAQGVNLRLIRQDDPTKMREDLVAFATELKAGHAHPSKGVALVAIMGDGSAAFLQELNAVLERVGPEYRAKVIGSAGYSWGEDKFMGPTAWQKAPSASRGGLVAGVLRDGDWNIAQKWLGENRLCNNPDEHTYDPNCLNWLGTPGYVEAAQAYIAGTCEERVVVSNGKPTGKTQRVCVDAVVTWTPGDVMVAQKKGGLVSLVSTREYRGQMPNVIIGIDRWLQANRSTVEGVLTATFAGADALRSNAEALAHAANVSAVVYGEEDGAYWTKYFAGVNERDLQGLTVELGGSRVNGLGDNLQLFGIEAYAPGSTNLFAATYTVFGNLVVAQYPELVPRISPVADVVDTSYLVALAKRQATTPQAQTVRFSAAEPVRNIVSRGDWSISFAPGSSEFAKEASSTLNALFEQLIIAGGAAVEIHGHTDSSGDPLRNAALSEERAFAVKRWLEAKSPANFPSGRVRVFAHGQENPVAPNATAQGRALNRRVEVVLGTTERISPVGD